MTDPDRPTDIILHGLAFAIALSALILILLTTWWAISRLWEAM